MICVCDNKNTGFTEREDGTWVHNRCLRPTRAWVEADPELIEMLNLFRGGPHHHELHETLDLLSVEFAWIANYHWSSEIVIGSETGRKARVWLYKGET